jgi:hypothetical protein
MSPAKSLVHLSASFFALPLCGEKPSVGAAGHNVRECRARESGHNGRRPKRRASLAAQRRPQETENGARQHHPDAASYKLRPSDVARTRLPQGLPAAPTATPTAPAFLRRTVRLPSVSIRRSCLHLTCVAGRAQQPRRITPLFRTAPRRSCVVISPPDSGRFRLSSSSVRPGCSDELPSQSATQGPPSLLPPEPLPFRG